MSSPEITGKAQPGAAAYTIREFCTAHRISVAHYYVLRNQGLGPDEAGLLRRKIITHEAAARWRKKRTAESKKLLEGK